MDTHLWVLPWLSVIVGGATLAVALFHSLRSASIENSPGFRPRIPSIVVWIALVIVGVLLELRVGAVQSVDYIGARGFLLGSIGGALLVLLTSRRLRLPSLAVFGTALTQLGIARLWLTHGEMTGLTAVALGTGLAVVCLDIDRLMNAVDGASHAVAGVVLTGTLAAAMQMGFTRATQINLAYWPDIPLLIASSIALGLLIGSAARGPQPDAEVPRRRLRVAAIIPILLAIIGTWCCTSALLHENTALKLIAMGLVAGALIYMLLRSGQNVAGAGLGLVLLFASISLAYAYWAGYGVALLIVGVWAIFAAIDIGYGASTMLIGALAVGTIVTVHRAISLQNGDNLSSTDITDTWNLLAAGIGAVLPLAALPSFLRSEPNAARPGLAPLAVARAVLILTIPTLLIAYLFATQASDALVVGALISTAAITVVRRASTAPMLGGVLLSYFVLQSMPLITQWKEPSRHVKVEILVALTVAAVILSLLPGRRQSEPANTAATEA